MVVKDSVEFYEDCAKHVEKEWPEAAEAIRGFKEPARRWQKLKERFAQSE